MIILHNGMLIKRLLSMQIGRRIACRIIAKWLMSILVVAILVLFVVYFNKVIRFVSGESLEEFGQFGDAFGFCTSIFTLLALLGLIWQIKQTEKHHDESIRQQRREHFETLHMQETHHAEVLAEQEKKYQISQDDQIKRHQELLQLERKQHKENLELQRMILVSAEHPVISSNAVSLHVYPLSTSNGDIYNLVIWCFGHNCNPVLRNPWFGVEFKDKDGNSIGTGNYRPGQLPVSNSESYEVILRVKCVRRLEIYDVCEITAAYQNSVGGCFHYSEVFRMHNDLSHGKTLSSEFALKCFNESILDSKSLCAKLMNGGDFGDGFLRTNDPIRDNPITVSAWEDLVKRLGRFARNRNFEYCLAVFDEEKLKRSLTAFLKNDGETKS